MLMVAFADGCWRTPPVDAADGRRDGTGVPQSDGAKFKLLSLSKLYFPTKHPIFLFSHQAPVYFIFHQAPDVFIFLLDLSREAALRRWYSAT